MSPASAETVNMDVNMLQPLQSVRVQEMVKLRHRAKFRGDRSYHCRDMAIFRFFQDGGRPLSWFVMRVFGLSMKGIWWFLSMCKMWLESMQYSFDNMHVFSISRWL